MKITIPRFQIDLPNHVIGFFSALFGILIAFELDDWREQRNQAALARIAFENLKKEIQINQNALHENITNNLDHIQDLIGILPKLDHQLRFIGTKREADSINSNFSKIIFIDNSGNEKTKRPLPVFIGMGNITTPSLQSSAWESAKSTGALNLMEYEKVLSLSFLYNHSTIIDELMEIKTLWRASDSITSKTELAKLLDEMEKSHQTVNRELQEFDQFVNIINAME
jgi:hypothetical protein